MSASLVGSEMCIRDSLEAPRALARRRWGGSAWLTSAGAEGSGSLGRCPCLLYTSDAADDM
eukprot:4280382-Alexandrium_andersonii.AAC.1